MDLRSAKYLNPKNDLTFRKIFGQYPDITKSLLNALLPFEEGRYIEHLTFQDPAMFPLIPELKHSIVDVHCTDNYGRQFIVEMQLYWTSSFKNRMLFNAGKAYVKQLDKGENYNMLKPVYGLSLVDDVFMTGEEFKDKYYHHYRLSHIDDPEHIIEGIELIFIELPKFKPQTMSQKKMQVLWLRFLTEIDEKTQEIPREFLKAKEINKALEHLQVSAFTKNELEYYDKYWDKIRVEKTAIEDAKLEAARFKEQADLFKEEVDRAREEADKAKTQADQARKQADQARKQADQARKQADRIKQIADQERKEKETAKQRLLESAALMKKSGLNAEQISKATGLSADEIENL